MDRFKLCVKSLAPYLLLLIATACSDSSSSPSTESKQGRTDITERFISVVGGKSYGPNDRYRFTEDGRFIKKVALKAIYSSDDQLANGQKVGQDGTLTCNFVVDAKLNRVTLNDRLPSWDLGPYELELTDEKVSLDPGVPFSNNRLPFSLAQLVCQEQFKSARVIEEMRIPNQYLYSYSSTQIQWSRGNGQFENVLKITDLARGSSVDLTEDAFQKLTGVWQGATVSGIAETLIVSGEGTRSLMLILFVANELAPIRCFAEISGRIASIRMNSEKEILIQLNQPKFAVRATETQATSLCETVITQKTAPTEIRIKSFFNDSIDVQADRWSSSRPLVHESRLMN